MYTFEVLYPVPKICIWNTKLEFQTKMIFRWNADTSKYQMGRWGLSITPCPCRLCEYTTTMSNVHRTGQNGEKGCLKKTDFTWYLHGQSVTHRLGGSVVVLWGQKANKRLKTREQKPLTPKDSQCSTEGASSERWLGQRLSSLLLKFMVRPCLSTPEGASVLWQTLKCQVQSLS